MNRSEHTSYANDSNGQAAESASERSSARVRLRTVMIIGAVAVASSALSWLTIHGLGGQQGSWGDVWTRLTRTASVEESGAVHDPAWLPRSWADQVSAGHASALPARHLRMRTAEEPSVRAAVLLPGAMHDASLGPVALPDGARFRLRLTSNSSGVVEIRAVNPLGETSQGPLWSGPVAAGQSVVTPMLRLEGQQGLETLQLVLHGSGPYPVAQGRVEIWHL